MKLESLINARKSAGLTQKEIADRCGILQSNISKIENGIYNPSLKILKRLADAMDMKLVIEFKEKTDEEDAFNRRA